VGALAVDNRLLAEKYGGQRVDDSKDSDNRFGERLC
jgi:hypothetical protein